MMNHIIDRTLEYLVLEKSISRDDADIYRFGLECMFLKIVHYISYFLIALTFHCLVSLIVSACVFAPLRSRIGGYHAKTRIGCYVFSCFMVVLLCILNEKQIPEWLFLSGVISADIVIYLRKPVENENNPHDPVEMQKFHKQAVVILLAVNVIILITLWQNMAAGRYLSNGIVMAAVLFMLGKKSVRNVMHYFY